VDTLKDHNYYVYILTNNNKTVLYTGVTNNLERKIYEHWGRGRRQLTGAVCGGDKVRYGEVRQANQGCRDQDGFMID